MILPRNFKVSGFSGAKMQMMSLCVKISSKDLDTILCFRQESVEDHEENKEGFLTGFFVSFGKTPIATYSYCHHLSDSFPLPDATDLFKWHIGQSQTVWWWILGECNENTMRMQCPSAISDLNISESNNVKLGLDCLAELLKVSFLSSLE
jgi:hypothetical protein